MDNIALQEHLLGLGWLYRETRLFGQDVYQQIKNIAGENDVRIVGKLPHAPPMQVGCTMLMISPDGMRKLEAARKETKIA